MQEVIIFFFQSVSTMDWPTEQVTSGKMDASTTVSVRMDTWDCTNVPRGERSFIYQVLKQYQFLIDKNAYCISGNFSWGSNFRFFCNHF